MDFYQYALIGILFVFILAASAILDRREKKGTAEQSKGLKKALELAVQALFTLLTKVVTKAKALVVRG